MNRLLASVLVLSLSTAGFIGCAGNKPPVLTPRQATAITNALAGLSTLLQQRGASPVMIAAIAAAQTAVASDVSGNSWGQIIRDLMTTLYTNLPLSLQNDPIVWGAMTAVEVTLAIIGA